MLPICLVTGFLGTGKTTFLKNIVAHNRDRKIVCLINEFSAHDVDGAIVSAENPNVVSIPGGSIFCKCLVTEFIGQLKKITEERSGFDGVVIEASGMANPKVIEQMLAETKLDQHFRLATIISIIDPNSFLKLRHTLPNILAQIEASDVVLINKTDRNSPEKTAEADAAVRAINPVAERIKTVQCAVEVDLFAEHVPRGLQGEYAKCRDPNYATFVTEQPVNGAALERFVLENSDDIYRVKGTLTGEFFDYSTAGVIRTAQSDAKPALAWIVKGGAEEKITAALEFLWMD
ncbi:MAG: GTP-binding protein [Kiritimatiellales bacterium]|nr:GTP-binding protein [Kiritimatiellales bacterium]